jgi:hypothetical protein
MLNPGKEPHHFPIEMKVPPFFQGAVPIALWTQPHWPCALTVNTEVLLIITFAQAKLMTAW